MYKLDERMVVHTDEMIVFNPRNFVVHKMNETAMMILSCIEHEGKSAEEIHEEHAEIPLVDIKEFLSAAVDAKFIIRHAA